MPRQTPLDNIGPNDLAYELAAPAGQPDNALPSLIVVTTMTQAGSAADKVQVVATAAQVDGNGRPVLVDGKRLTIDEAVEEFPRDGYLYQHRRDMSMAAATRFEAAGVAVPQFAPAPPAPAVAGSTAPGAPAVAASTPVATSVQPGATTSGTPAPTPAPSTPPASGAAQ